MKLPKYTAKLVIHTESAKSKVPGVLRLGRMGRAEGILAVQVSQRKLLKHNTNSMEGSRVVSQRHHTKTKNRTSRKTGVQHEGGSDGGEIQRLSISDSCIENRNRVILQMVNSVPAEETWEVGRKLGISYNGDEKDVVDRLKDMEARDRVEK
ncbi:hypothetical protein Ancab_006442, partial [Ancistrocladus abbreviatus]